jgi:hypothetical protein
MERRPDREQAALEWAHEVESRLSMLTLVIPTSLSSTPALSVKLDGREVARREWGTPVALDPGEHSVSITAEGKKPWNARIVLGQVADRRTFTVHLDDVAEEQAPTERSSGLSTAQKVGIGAAIGGVVAVGIGTFFGVRAVIRNDRSDAGCDGNACDPEAKQLRLDAREDGNRATVAFITGGVLLAGGAGLFFLGKDSGDKRGHLQAAPLLGLREVGLAVGGAF